MEIKFIGEHLLPGQLGNFFVILSFVFSILATVSFFSAAKNPLENSWLKLARLSFRIHSFSVIGIIVTLFIMIMNHYFEYQYVWQHSSKILPMRYMLSCFWEGQEGSFLLWSFWHIILGNILLKISDSFQAPVMTVVSSVQVFLSSMLLGVFVFDYRIGSNPFLLLREHPEFSNLPFTKVANYLENLDGRGLNPLLQNYWMTIHPPTLFLGFALTLIPFAYAIAGLWKRDLHSWLKPALPWTFVCIAILGTGILMGGAWAYESLSFGGFWAWDPVENASLVPWLTLVGAGHLMLINKNKGSSLLSVFILTCLTFILILYSTFLTRSGILGNTSVHAFTDLGMSGQLLIYLLCYVFLSFFLLIRNRNAFKSDEKEESIFSREFWMFVGALILLISAFQIIFSTSIPVINKIFSSNLAPPAKPIEHYNSWQVPIAILTCLLIAFTQFLKYKSTNSKEFFKSLSFSFFVSLGLSMLFVWQLELTKPFYAALLFTSLFSCISNLDYFVKKVKNKLYKGGASIAHIGISMLLLGALISTSKSEVISRNSSGLDVSKLGKDFNNAENILLRIGDTLKMGPYYVAFKGKTQEGLNHYFQVDYFSKQENGKLKFEFALKPFVQTNPKMGNAAEPDTRHYWNKDVYTHITYADLSQLKGEEESGQDYKNTTNHSIATGDTIFTANSIVILDALFKDVKKEQFNLSDSDIAVGAKIRVIDVKSQVRYAYPIFVISGNLTNSISSKIDTLGLKFDFTGLDPETGKVDIVVAEKEDSASKFIVMKAIIFPYINLLWMGCLIMIIGTMMAVVGRLMKN